MDFAKLQILEFKLENMVRDPAIVIIAKRGAGKSYLARDILYHYRHLPGGVVIAPTDRMNPLYKYFFPDLYVHYDITESIFQKVLARQKLMIEKAKTKKKRGKKVDPSSVLVMDDCLSQKSKWSKDENIREILMNGRHYQLTYILTMQYIVGIGPELRSNFDYIFLLKEDSALNKKKLWDNYASIFPTCASFEKVFQTCTKDNCTMVVDNRKPADTIPEKIFWFKAKRRRFSFGSKKFKDLHKKYYDPKFMIKGAAALLDAGTLFGKRKKNDLEMRVEKI